MWLLALSPKEVGTKALDRARSDLGIVTVAVWRSEQHLTRLWQ